MAYQVNFLNNSPAHHPDRVDQRSEIVATANTARKSRWGQLSYRLAPTPTITPKGVYIGELHEKWQFPSDHLPIGLDLDGLKMVSWNVLNPIYMHWVTEEDSQGLSRSLIVQEHVHLPEKTITAREARIISDILKMIQGQDVLALQECGMNFLKELESKLPSHFKLVREQDINSLDQNALIYDTRKLTLVDQKRAENVFSQDTRPFMDLLFQRNDRKEPIRLINAHLPGNPMGPARYEFASYVEKIDEQESSIVALGDMNFNELQMRDAFKKGSFEVYTPYCTNITPYIYVSTAIDHFIIQSKGIAVIQKPDEIYPALSRTIALLETAK